MLPVPWSPVLPVGPVDFEGVGPAGSVGVGPVDSRYVGPEGDEGVGPVVS